jgi:hypothetical protein
MRIDHVSNAISHDQPANAVQLHLTRLAGTFVGGRIQLCWGIRNLMLASQNDHYLEVVRPLYNPSAESTQFGKVVSQRIESGYGWSEWVVAVDDVPKIEENLGRSAVDVHFIKLGEKDLEWKQIGVILILDDKKFPLFIGWLSLVHL